MLIDVLYVHVFLSIISALFTAGFASTRDNQCCLRVDGQHPPVHVGQTWDVVQELRHKLAFKDQAAPTMCATKSAG